MRIFLVVFGLLFSLQALGQQYSQYNTGTLYESFENPSVQSFTPDSSRNIAFNFFVPNISGNFYLTGNAQSPLKSRAFNGRYNDSYLRIGENAFNRVNANANVYLVMLRVFRSLNGNADMGFSVQTRMESRGLISDESIGIFNGAKTFPLDQYSGIFNDNFHYQAYHQISFSYRENVTKRFAFGVKLSALLGIEYQDLDVKNSSLEIDRLNDNAVLGLAGRYRISYSPGGFTRHDFLPTFRHPGASISMGATLKPGNKFIIQANVKDLGFIHWSKLSSTSNFNTTDSIRMLSGPKREDSIYNAAYRVVRSAGVTGSFVTPTNGKIEISANRTFSLNYENTLRYSPTLILSKELFYAGTSIAMVNPIAYKNLSLTATTSYDSYRIFHIGGQFMVKSSNAEFFIGSERFTPSGRLFLAARGNEGQIARTSPYTGADFFMGFSVKIGSVIEHPMNASVIPMGEDSKGFFGRLWSRLFNGGE